MNNSKVFLTDGKDIFDHLTDCQELYGNWMPDWPFRARLEYYYHSINFNLGINNHNNTLKDHCVSIGMLTRKIMEEYCER